MPEHWVVGSEMLCPFEHTGPYSVDNRGGQMRFTCPYRVLNHFFYFSRVLCGTGIHTRSQLCRMIAPRCPVTRHVQRVRNEACLHLPVKIAYRTPSIRERSDSRKKRPADKELRNRKNDVTAGKLDQAIAGGAPDAEPTPDLRFRLQTQ